MKNSGLLVQFVLKSDLTSQARALADHRAAARARARSVPNLPAEINWKTRTLLAQAVRKSSCCAFDFAPAH
eukprot:2049913-Rhodomonas_salina.1